MPYCRIRKLSPTWQSHFSFIYQALKIVAPIAREWEEEEEKGKKHCISVAVTKCDCDQFYFLELFLELWEHILWMKSCDFPDLQVSV